MYVIVSASIIFLLIIRDRHVSISAMKLIMGGTPIFIKMKATMYNEAVFLADSFDLLNMLLRFSVISYFMVIM